ncbi:acetylcholinesterase-1-like isoform X1 [Varroa jacobsoni]|uniref:acetylcholinesterase-1-like isoform X1 n=2 Tax=Varroa jacobsoni TaxID=62625 RepID=UPI000BF28C5C|nr:acetylcholinesterase-1-like isoform X1 [Varroa jacobsoni]
MTLNILIRSKLLFRLIILVGTVALIDSKCYILMPQDFYEKHQDVSEKSIHIDETKGQIISLPKNYSQVKIIVEDDNSALTNSEVASDPAPGTCTTLWTTTSLRAEISRQFFNRRVSTSDTTSKSSSGTQNSSTAKEQVPKMPVVRIKSGIIMGLIDTSAPNTVYKFLGVPFAEPPLGKLRFKHPVEISPWSGVFEAHRKPLPCLQGPFYINSNWTIDNVNSTEDCLYLNLWTPDSCVTSTNSECTPNKSVMVFIYGGTYTFGSSGWEMYDGAQLAGRGNVVVVTFNYRVGPLGFLYGGNQDAPGNAGLFDQLMVLKWVQDNIIKLGGDPRDVTLFGQSAGAISIGFHMVSPLSQGLFHKVIMESGSPLFRLTDPTREGPKKIEKLAYAMDCIQDGQTIETHSKEVVTCLQNKDGKELVNTTLFTFGINALTFFPIHGDTFLPEPAEKLINTGKLAKVPLLIGNNKDEGSYFVYYLFGRSLKLEDVSMVTKYEVDLYMTFSLQMLLQTNVRTIRERYLRNVKEDEGRKAIRKAAELVGDLAMICPTKYFAEQAAMQGLNVHYYEFNFRSSFGTWPDWVGTTHGEEIPFVFGHPLSGLEPNATNREKEVSKEIISIWTDFAKTGRVPVKVGGVPWPRYTADEQALLLYGPEQNSLRKGPNEQMCNFWRKYILESY